jgi:hypothetical protein
MIHEILAFVVNLLIVDPLQAEMDKRLADVRAPQAVIADVKGCADAALPGLTDRVMSEPGWILGATLDIWLGTGAPEKVLADVAPQCEAPLRAARSYLEGRGA